MTDRPPNKRMFSVIASEKREKEIRDKEGFESKYIAGYVGHAFISLDQLEISRLVSGQISRTKVMFLKNSMKQTFDPSLCSITVAPKDQNNFSQSDFSQSNYTVIHGAHRIQALNSYVANSQLIKDVDSLIFLSLTDCPSLC